MESSLKFNFRLVLLLNRVEGAANTRIQRTASPRCARLATADTARWAARLHREGKRRRHCALPAQPKMALWSPAAKPELEKALRDSSWRDRDMDTESAIDNLEVSLWREPESNNR